MADPLTFLRTYNINKKEIIIKDNHILFGDLSWSKTVNTNFLMYGYVNVYFHWEIIDMHNMYMVHHKYHVRFTTYSSCDLVIYYISDIFFYKRVYVYFVLVLAKMVHQKSITHWNVYYSY